jgi:hypothetical protein
MPLRKGQFVHFTRAHYTPCDIWVVVLGRDGDAPKGRLNGHYREYEGRVVAGSNGSWRPGSRSVFSNIPEATDAWQNGAVRYTFVPPRKVPDWVFVEMARSALLNEGTN